MRVLATLAASALPLAACQLESTITIVPHGTTPDFVVTYDRGRRACVAGLTVTEVDGAARREVWALLRHDQSTHATCRDRFTYGTKPAGYDVAVPLQALHRGRLYEVSANGPGWTAVETLKVP